MSKLCYGYLRKDGTFRCHGLSVFKDRFLLNKLVNLDTKGLKRRLKLWAKIFCKGFLENYSISMINKALKILSSSSLDISMEVLWWKGIISFSWWAKVGQWIGEKAAWFYHRPNNAYKHKRCYHEGHFSSFVRIPLYVQFLL